MVSDAHRLIGSLVHAKAQLHLETADLCLLVALRARAEVASLVSFEESLLVDTFEEICVLTDPAAESPRKRATHAIQRLRDQRMLARVDGVGLLRPGEYSLTRLATALVDFFLSDEALTRESLTVLTKTLLSELAAITQEARRATTPDAWRQGVVERLRVTVSELLGGIERRQRGMDAQQEEVRAEIAGLLQKDWFAAVDACEALLEKTASTLRELAEVLLQDASHLQGLLQEIEGAADAASAGEAAAAVAHVSEQVDRAAAWGGERQRAWGEYYQYVQGYLRSVVRLDPDRALSQRLRDQLAHWPERPFALAIADAPALRVMREVSPRPETRVVARAPRDWQPALQDTAPERDELEQQVAQALAAGAASLKDVLEQVLTRTVADKRFVSVGRVAAIVARLRPVVREYERPWHPVGPELEAQDWVFAEPAS